MNAIDLLMLCTGVGYSFLLISLIDNGMPLRYQLYALLVVVVIAALYGLLAQKTAFDFLNRGFISLPVWTVACYNLLNLLSHRLNKRPFLLKIKGSRNINNDATNASDRLFSFLLIFSLILWPFAVALALKYLSIFL
ncbi:MAG: hypothetical protein QM687_06145 [Ferruginibacter sp.]